MKKTLTSLFFFTLIFSSFSQEKTFEKFNFLIGNWSGTGEGFGNEGSIVNSSFNFIMNGKYIEVINESKFEPAEKKPEGEHHIDKGCISIDNSRNLYIFRQFNNEGFVNQYYLDDTLSNDSVFVFGTEPIENFVPGGKARRTIKKLSDNTYESVFELSFPGKEFACFGKNKLIRK